MSKRFTDTDKWKKPLIRGLQAPYKLLWLYILDDCDHAGIWQVDIEVASIRIGEQLSNDEAVKNFGDRIIPFDNGEKWFIPNFIEFQYGELNAENRVHASVISQLVKYDLLKKFKDLISPLQGAKDKDKDKEKDKDKDGKEGLGGKPKDEVPAVYRGRKLIVPAEWPENEFVERWNQHRIYRRKQHQFTWKDESSEQVAINNLHSGTSGESWEWVKGCISFSESAGWMKIIPEAYRKHIKQSHKPEVHNGFSKKIVAP